jgi:hypothetical protein
MKDNETPEDSRMADEKAAIGLQRKKPGGIIIVVG